MSTKCDKCGEEPAHPASIVGSVATTLCTKCRDELHLLLSTDYRDLTIEYQTAGMVFRRAQQIGSSNWEAKQIIEDFMDAEARLGSVVRGLIAGEKFDITQDINDWLNSGGIGDADEA